jgi:hypothetical protein
MCPETVRQPSAERHPVDRSVAVAAISAWLIYVAIYAVLFTLSERGLSIAIRGALANGIPDGLLALTAYRVAARIDRRRSASRGLLRAHALPALVVVGLAFAVKTLLLWADMFLVRGESTFRIAASVSAWQAFISSLLYVAVAASAHAWLTARRLREEEAHAARAEALRTRAEMSTLRAQLNPHFLFNVLHSALGLVRRDPALAETALEQLGDLLRYAIHVHRDGADWTALRNEWEFMEAYLELEKIRLGERLRVSLHVEPGALDQTVPTFSLQPLVENAVRHGVSPRAAGGRVEVDSRMEGDTLRLRVRNDADGSPAKESGDRPGVGLHVLRERLAVLYRGRARMNVGPTVDGFEVLLVLPRHAGGAENGP